MRRLSVSPAFRYRLLHDGQATAIRRAYDAGVSPRSLAIEYGVHVRTIYRTIMRAATERHEVVEVDGWYARFALTDDGPVQTTPWYAKAKS